MRSQRRKFCIIHRFSSYNRLIRVISYCRHFLNKKLTGPLTTKELEGTVHCLIRMIQNLHFSVELNDLKIHKAVKKQSPLSKLNPFLDGDIIRLGGRLKHSSIAYTTKYPAILPKRHKFTEFFIEHTHKKNLHTGINQTLALVRESYWIIDGKNEVRRILHRCISCFKTKAQPASYQMGNLPKVRVSAARPFKYCGGPLYIKESGTRSKQN